MATEWAWLIWPYKYKFASYGPDIALQRRVTSPPFYVFCMRPFVVVDGQIQFSLNLAWIVTTSTQIQTQKVNQME